MQFPLNYPLSLSFKIVAMAPQLSVTDARGSQVAYIKQKLFKLKEDIRVYADESKQHEILTIKARTIIDFSAAYDVVDSQANQKVGAVRRRGWKSIVRDEWDLLDPADQVIGKVREAGFALLRRFIKLLPQSYDITLGTARVGGIKQSWNPFVFKAVMDPSADPQRLLDRRLALAAGVLLMAIEGRQE